MYTIHVYLTLFLLVHLRMPSLSLAIFPQAKSLHPEINNTSHAQEALHGAAQPTRFQCAFAPSLRIRGRRAPHAGVARGCCSRCHAFEACCEMLSVPLLGFSIALLLLCYEAPACFSFCSCTCGMGFWLAGAPGCHGCKPGTFQVGVRKKIAQEAQKNRDFCKSSQADVQKRAHPSTSRNAGLGLNMRVDEFRDMHAGRKSLPYKELGTRSWSSAGYERGAWLCTRVDLAC